MKVTDRIYADVQVAGLACSGSQPGVRGFDSLRRYHVRGGVEGVGILRLSFKQEFAGSNPVTATMFGGVGKR